VTTCEVDFRVRMESPSAQPNDPLFPKQWNMAAIKAPGAWAAGQLGGPLGGPQGQVRPAPAPPAGEAAAALRRMGGTQHRRGHQQGCGLHQVRVCMVDTGTDVTHPDLQPNLWMNAIEMNGPGATAANGYQNGIDDDGNGAPARAPLARSRSTMPAPHSAPTVTAADAPCRAAQASSTTSMARTLSTAARTATCRTRTGTARSWRAWWARWATTASA